MFAKRPALPHRAGAIVNQFVFVSFQVNRIRESALHDEARFSIPHVDNVHPVLPEIAHATIKRRSTGKPQEAGIGKQANTPHRMYL